MSSIILIEFVSSLNSTNWKHQFFSKIHSGFWKLHRSINSHDSLNYATLRVQAAIKSKLHFHLKASKRMYKDNIEVTKHYISLDTQDTHAARSQRAVTMCSSCHTGRCASWSWLDVGLQVEYQSRRSWLRAFPWPRNKSGIQDDTTISWHRHIKQEWIRCTHH